VAGGGGHPIGRRVATIAGVIPIGTSAPARSNATSKRPVTDTTWPVRIGALLDREAKTA
jgi:hypothetical protein